MDQQNAQATPEAVAVPEQAPDRPVDSVNGREADKFDQSEVEATRPDWLPEKFWDEHAGAPRIEELAKSYRHLERKLGSESRLEAPVPVAEERAGADEHHADSPEFDPDVRRALGIPDSPEDYDIRSVHPLLEPDPEINADMHVLGFTPRQVQYVYDLAAERIIPALEEMRMGLAREVEERQLVDSFGGRQRYEEVARQVRAWGEANLPGELFETLSGSGEGVALLHSAMKSGEPALLAGPAKASVANEDSLRQLVDDPRYWRDHEPDIVRQVEDGFRRLYPE